MIGRVVIGDAAKFHRNLQKVSSRVLHELAHGYHNQVLGLESPEIKDAFENAVASHLYENVRDHAGRKHKKSYALTNKSEYFALLTQAYFERSGYYPFDRNDLARYDPQGFNVARIVWEERDGPQPSIEFESTIKDKSCSNAANTKSLGGQLTTHYTIRNQSNTPITLLWIGYNGKRKTMIQIAPNHFYSGKAISTHAWELSNDESNSCVGIFQSGPIGVHIDLF